MDPIPAMYVVLAGISGAILGLGIGLLLHRGNADKYPKWSAGLWAGGMAAVCAASVAQRSLAVWIVGVPLLLVLGMIPVLLGAAVGALVAALIGRR